MQQRHQRVSPINVLQGKMNFLARTAKIRTAENAEKYLREGGQDVNVVAAIRFIWNRHSGVSRELAKLAKLTIRH